MLKLLLCIFCGAVTALVALQMRQQNLNLAYQNNKLHNQIEATQSQLWNQQLSIAECTAPNAIAATVKAQDLKLTPPKPGSARGNWVDDPDAAE